jgi:NAD(P)-dependent dehydrogenase (short-subunit alcohol dehydrogenase family)
VSRTQQKVAEHHKVIVGQRRGSRIGSGAGRLGIPGLGLYSASKFALEALAEAYHYELASQGIDSVIVEPGAYVTAISEKRAYTAEASRASAYGPANEIPKRLSMALSSSRANPQEVVDAIVELIELPAGNRPLRVPVGLPDMDGFGNLNQISDQLLKDFLTMTGIAPLAAFQSRANSAE